MNQRTIYRFLGENTVFSIHINKIPIDNLEYLPKYYSKKKFQLKIDWNQKRIVFLSKSPCQNVLLNLARATILTIHTLLAGVAVVVVVAFFSAFAEISKATQHFNIMRYSFRGLYILCINRLRCRLRVAVHKKVGGFCVVLCDMMCVSSVSTVPLICMMHNCKKCSFQGAFMSWCVCNASAIRCLKHAFYFLNLCCCCFSRRVLCCAARCCVVLPTSNREK